MNEIVIAKTGYEHAQHMQRTLIGHTMSGEALEQRPQVQYASAADFLGAAMSIYEITAIRLAPSKYPSLIEVIAAYRLAIFQCEACGKGHSRYPERIYGLKGIGVTRCFVCSDACKKYLQAIADAETEAFRAELGNPVEATLDYYYRREKIPDRLRNALTMAEWEEVGRRGSQAYRGAHSGLLGILSLRCAQQKTPFLQHPSVKCTPWTPSQVLQLDLWEEDLRKREAKT